MSDPILTSEERWLRGALRAEEDSLPVRLGPEDLHRRWLGRRRQGLARRLGLLAAAVAVVAVGLGATWSMWPWGKPLAVQPPIDGPSSVVAGPISVTQTPVAGPGLSAGQATLTLTAPKAAPSSFAVGCIWSVSGHVVGMTVGKQVIGGEYLFVHWKPYLGPQYQIELVQPDQTSFIGLGGNYTSQATADGRSGSLSFTDLILNSGDPSTAPRRSGTFTWTCEHAATLGRPAPTLLSPTADENDVPVLWILQNGAPTRRALTGCPISVTTPSVGFATSCATSDWWKPLESLNSTLEVEPGDSLAFALDGWTVTSAAVEAARTSLPAGSFENPLVDLHPTLGSGAVSFSPPGTGNWYVHFTIEAARDDGSTLQAEYGYPISVP